MNLAIFIFTARLFVDGVDANTPPIPPEATALILRVHSASQRSDLSALRALMAAEFTWSFGVEGDSSRDSAIRHWKRQPEELKALSRATGATCAFVDEIVECPRDAGIGYRAGFKQTPNRWRLIYFVAGD